MERAVALIGVSTELADCATTEDAARIRHESKRILKRVIRFVCRQQSCEQVNDCIGRGARKERAGRNAVCDEGSGDGLERLLDTSFQRLGGVDHSLGQSDGLEPGSDFQIELEIAIAGGMCSHR